MMINYFGRRFGGGRATSLAGLGCALALLSLTASAEPLLRCQISQGDSVNVVDFAAVRDPYRVAPVDIGEHFRFKAVVMGEGNSLDYVKLYVYVQSARGAVLLHEAKYLAPKAVAGSRLDALTGTHYLYSPELGRELRYGCALLESGQ